MIQTYPYVSSAVSSASDTPSGGGAEAEAEADGFFACPAGVFDAVAVVRPVVVAAAADGRVVAGLAEEAREVRGARVAAASAEGRVVEGRFAAVVAVAVAVEGASEGLDAGLLGDGRAAVLDVTGGLRTAVGFFLPSSPDVTEATSGSASEAVLDEETVLRAAVPGTGRVGGLFRVDPTVLVREVELEGGFAAVVVRVVAVAGATGRPAAAVVLDTVGRRGAAASLAAGEGPLEAILRRTEEVGVEGAGSFFGPGLPAGKLSEAAVSMRRVWAQGPALISALCERLAD